MNNIVMHNLLCQNVRQRSLETDVRSPINVLYTHHPRCRYRPPRAVHDLANKVHRIPSPPSALASMSPASGISPTRDTHIRGRFPVPYRESRTAQRGWARMAEESWLFRPRKSGCAHISRVAIRAHIGFSIQAPYFRVLQFRSAVISYLYR